MFPWAECGRSRPLAPPLAVLVGDEGRHDDAALDDFLVVRVDVEEGEAGCQDAEDDRADHRAGHAADAAGVRGAADNRGGDAVELEGDADAGRAGRGIGRRFSSGLGSARSWLRRFPDTSLESLP